MGRPLTVKYRISIKNFLFVELDLLLHEATTMKNRFVLMMGMTTALIFGGICQSARATMISALTSTNRLIMFDSFAPGTILDNRAVSGLTAGDVLVGIDYAPLTLQLGGIGYNSVTGTARFYGISGEGNAFGSNRTLALGVGLSRVTADFDPRFNELRVVTSAITGNNLRVLSGGLGVLATDTNLNPANADIRATAHSRNNFGGGTSGATTLYAIDGTNNQLVTLGSTDFFTGSGTSPNSGTLTNVAALTGVTGSAIVGFEIFNAQGTAAATPGTAFVATSTNLFELNLATGAATPLGAIGGGFTIQDITAVPEPSSIAFATMAIAGLIVGYRRRKHGFR